MHLIPPAVLAALALAACAPDDTRLTPQQQRDFADAMTEPDPLSSSEIPSAGRFPGR